MKLYISILGLCLLLVSCIDTKKDMEPEQNTPELSVAQSIALASGVDQWDDVKEINFTFNVDRGENHFERAWSWNPKTDDVSFYSGSDTIQYNRNHVDSLLQKTDRGFVNDSYWLLAPFKLVWDNGTNTSEPVRVLAPISNDSLHKLTLTYGDEGGYTPGDAYDFYYDENFKVKEWVFRQGNQEQPSMVTTFEGYQNFNGLQLATMHQDSTGTFKLYFTDISVKK